LDKKKLNNNILSFANPKTHHNITHLPASRVSDAFVKVILEIVHEMPVNLNPLSKQEMALLTHIIKSSKMKFDNKISNNENELLNRLQLITGEISAGNNSKLLKNELSGILNSLHQSGELTANEVITFTKKYIMK